MSSCGMVPCLSAYSVIVTTVLVIISILYSNTGTTIIRKCDNIGTQEVQGQTQNHVDILTIDVSSNEQQLGKEGECKCKTLEWLGFQLFEIIILALVGIGIASGCFKCTHEGRKWFGKWMEARKAAEFKKLRLRYEASNTARQSTAKIETVELAGYENGDNFQSDDVKAANNRK